jgi:hypothetical protein
VNRRFVSPPREALAKLRQPLTSGEWQVFQFFDELLDPAWEIYIQPHLNGLRPDFVLLNPAVGIAVFEVKDWDLDAVQYWIEDGSRPVLMGEKDGCCFSHQRDNPVEKAYLYKEELFNIYCPRLQQNAGFAVITAGIIFPYADDNRVRALLESCLEYRGMTEYPDYNPVSGQNALRNKRLSLVFPESRRSNSKYMSADMANDLRNWLVEPDFAASQRSKLELDRTQLSFIQSRTETGYRRIRGPAGSGKSLVLAGRAAELVKEGKNVLVVTFNITLLHYLMDVAVRWGEAKGRTRSSVTWLNFHSWCRRVCAEDGSIDRYEALWVDGNHEHVLNVRLAELAIEVLSSPQNAAPKYDAVLVDEGQDFLPIWWTALRKACKQNGEMLLVADATQDVYGTAAAWTDEAMTGAGFSGKWAELEVSYRMPEEALFKAAEFAKSFLPDATRILPIPVQNELALYPCDLRWIHADADAVAHACVDEILRMVGSPGHEHYSVADITFLSSSKALGHEVVSKLYERGIRCVHTFSDDERESRRQKVGFYMGDARVKATTLHSFKGWESRSLVVHLPSVITAQSLALTYAGLTRLKRHQEGSSLTVVSSAEKLQAYGRGWPHFEDRAQPIVFDFATPSAH